MSNKHPTQTFDEQGVTQCEVNWRNRVLLACAYMDPRLCLKQDVMSANIESIVYSFKSSCSVDATYQKIE